MVVADEHIVIQIHNQTDLLYLNVIVQTFTGTTGNSTYNLVQ